jgi:hypothetical protein
LTNSEEIFAGRLSVMAKMQAEHNDEVHPDWLIGTPEAKTGVPRDAARKAQTK